MTPPLTTAEAAALDAIDDDGAAALLMDLLAVPSVTGTDAESDLQHRLAKHLEGLGLDVDLWSMDLGELCARSDFPGTEAPRSEAWGLVGDMPAADGPTVILQGHVDVVPPGDLARWEGAPFTPTVKGGTIYGRGTCDMKAGLAANLAAVAAIRKSGVRLRGRVSVQCVVSEEDGGLGAFGTLARGHGGDLCIITEPTSGTITTANGGALTFTLTIPGLATHASTRDAGVSAIDAYLPLHQALKDLERRRNVDPDPLMAEYGIPYTISVGRLQAGDWSSSVPDLAVAEGRMGVVLDEDPAAARAELERAIAEACAADPWLRDHPATVAWTGGQFASGRTPLGHPLADLVADAHADATGTDRPRRRGAPYGSDLRLYAHESIPTLHYGPGDVRLAHGPNESVPLADLVSTTRTLVLATLRAAGTF